MEKINYDSDSDWSSNESEPKDPFLGAEPFTDSYRPLNGPEFELFQYWNVSLDLNTSHSTDPSKESLTRHFYNAATIGIS